MRSRAVQAMVGVVAVGTLVAAVNAPSFGQDVSFGAAAGRPLEILVTNDDGIAAAGIDAVVEALRSLPNVHVTVVAPATNQSGTGDAYNTGPLVVGSATTASGFAATTVAGKPADTVLYAVKGLGLHPDLVVSGINFGQNIADFVTLSGTVGASRTAARLGIPSIAVSAGLGAPMDYDTPAAYTAALVSFFRSYYLAPQTGATAKIFNINTPACTPATVRGLVVVPAGRSEAITGYQSVGGGSVQATTTSRDLLAVDCASTKTNVVDDLDALNNGFAALSILNPDLTDL